MALYRHPDQGGSWQRHLATAQRVGALATQAGRFYNEFKRAGKRKAQDNGMRTNTKRRKYDRPHRGFQVGNKRNPRFTKKVKKSSGRSRRKPTKVIVSKRQVKHWNKAAKLARLDTGMHTEYTRNVLQTICVKGQSIFKELSVNNSTQIKEFLDSLQYYDNAVLVQRDAIALGKSFDFFIKTYSKSTWVNNFQIPVWADFYLMDVLIPTPSPPSVFYAAGLVDRGMVGDAQVVTDVHAYPTQSKVLNTNYKIKKHVKLCLKPGESYSMDCSHRFKWDEEWFNTNSEVFQPTFKTHFYCVRLEGVICHTELTPFVNISTSAGGVDQMIDIKATVEYGAGMNVRPLHGVNNSQVISGNGVVCFENNTDNRVFSSAP